MKEFRNIFLVQTTDLLENTINAFHRRPIVYHELSVLCNYLENIIKTAEVTGYIPTKEYTIFENAFLAYVCESMELDVIERYRDETLFESIENLLHRFVNIFEQFKIDWETLVNKTFQKLESLPLKEPLLPENEKKLLIKKLRKDTRLKKHNAISPDIANVEPKIAGFSQKTDLKDLDLIHNTFSKNAKTLCTLYKESEKNPLNIWAEMYQAMLPDYSIELERFFSTILKFNACLKPEKKLDLVRLIARNFSNINILIYLLEKESFRHFNSLLVGDSFDKFENFLRMMQIYPPNMIIYLKNYIKTIPNLKEELENIQNIFQFIYLQLLGFNEYSKVFHENLIIHSADKYIDQLKTIRSLTPTNFLKKLVGDVLKKIFCYEDCSITHEQLNQLCTNNLSKIFNLLSTSAHMKEDQNRQIYNAFLIVDLFGEPHEIESIIHHKTMDNEDNALSRLGQHNQRIAELLVSHNIVPQSALNYPRTMTMCLTSLSETKPLEIIDLIPNYLENMLTVVTQLEPPPEKIISRIHNLQEIFQKNANNAKRSLNKIKSKLSVLLKQLNQYQLENKNELIIHTYHELKTHIQETYDSAFKEDGPKKPMTFFNINTQNKSFKFIQWSKNNPQTFHLGNDIGCSLSTNNSQFYALLQRRLDDALLFHVAINEINNQPVALICLYLGLVNGEVALIANSFEVNAAYGKNEHLRIALLQGLLKFTEQYLEDNPCIKHFYMSPISYGWNHDDLQQFPIVEITVEDKIGGPFIPSYIYTEEQTIIENYYLDPLIQQEFHKYQSTKLDNNMTITWSHEPDSTKTNDINEQINTLS